MRTIAAVSTPPGCGGIAVIRISGDEAFCVTDRIFKAQGAKRLFEVPANTVVFGRILDKDDAEIDQVLVTVFKAPHSFTGEDVIEISCHGGVLVAKKVLKRAIEAGAALAESIIDLIHAASDKGANAAVFQLEGRLSKEILDLRETLLHLESHLEAAADFPEEDIEELETGAVIDTLKKALANIERMLKTADYGKILREGMPVAVIGKPNVGKSSILNYLAGQERAIVTDVAGTTRDVIEETVNLFGIPVRLMDTAGIHETEDTVEKIGVEKSRSAAEDAALILAVFDASKPLDEEDEAVKKLAESKKHIFVLNKADLGKYVDLDGILVSAKSGENMDGLMRKIADFAQEDVSDSDTIITNERHFECLSRCFESVSRALSSAECGMPQDMLAIDIQQAIEDLGEITGQTVSQEIVDRIFHNFCLGK